MDNKSVLAVSGKVKVYFYSAIVLGIICAVLRSCAYLFSFNAQVGYFDKSFIVTLADALIIVGALWLCSSIFLIPKSSMSGHTIHSTGNGIYFASLLAGFILLGDFAYKIVTYISDGTFSELPTVFSPSYYSETVSSDRVIAILTVIGVVSSALASVCFFMRSGRSALSKASLWLGLFPVLRLLSGVAMVYFEMHIAMNSSSKLILMFLMLLLVICFLNEERFIISEQHSRPLNYFVFALLAVLLGITAGISEIVGYFSGMLHHGGFCIEAFLCLIMSVYVITRLGAFVSNIHRFETVNVNADIADIPVVAGEYIEDEDEDSDPEN